MHSTARTNYFRVSNVDELKASLGVFNCELHLNNSNTDFYCILGAGESGFSITIDTEYGQWHEFDFEKHVMPFVEEGEVVIVLEVGYVDILPFLKDGVFSYVMKDKLRSIAGAATALVRKGDVIQRLDITLNDIYDMAAEEFGKPLEMITKAEY